MMNADTIRTSINGSVLTVSFNRPLAKNALTATMVNECLQIMADKQHENCHVVVWRGSPAYFCSGADFAVHAQATEQCADTVDPNDLYRLWEMITADSRIHVALVQGNVSGGGVGFVAACDIAMTEPDAQFSLPELLFGLFPACVMPFLVRRIGWQASHYLALTTRPITGKRAHEIGLADECDADIETTLRKLLLRLRHLDAKAIGQYKSYANTINVSLSALRDNAIRENQTMFANPTIQARLQKFHETGQFPWE